MIEISSRYRPNANDRVLVVSNDDDDEEIAGRVRLDQIGTDFSLLLYKNTLQFYTPQTIITSNNKFYL